MTLVLKLIVKLVGFLTILIALNPTDQPVCLEKAQLIEYLSNVQSICLSSTTMASNSHSQRKTQQASTRLNQPQEVSVETIPITSTTIALSQVPISAPILALSTYSCFIHPRRLVKNYETLHRLVSLRKLSKKAMRRPVKSTVSRPIIGSHI